MIENLKWWLVALLPRFLARRIWLWSERSGVPLGSWAQYIFGQSIGYRGRPKIPPRQFVFTEDNTTTGLYLGPDGVRYCLDGRTVTKEAFVDGVISKGWVSEAARGEDPEKWWQDACRRSRK